MGLHLITGYAGKEHITSADQGSYNAAMVGNGEFVLERGSRLQASIISNNKVRILDGDLMMQGRHVRLAENTYEELDFENGTQGCKRNDLIVARYTKDSTTGIEAVNFVVIKGTPTSGTPLDPVHQIGNIISENALVNDMLLYRVPLDGLNMQDLVPLFIILPTIESRLEAINRKVEEAVGSFKENDLLDTVEEIEANTSKGKFAGARAVRRLKDTLTNSIDTLNSSLATTNANVTQCFQSVSDGKRRIASAITDKGVTTAADATFQVMSNNINSIKINTAPASMYFELKGIVENNGGYKGEVHFTINLYNMYNKITKANASGNGHLLIYDSLGNLMRQIQPAETATFSFPNPVAYVRWDTKGGGTWDSSFTAHN